MLTEMTRDLFLKECEGGIIQQAILDGVEPGLYAGCGILGKAGESALDPLFLPLAFTPDITNALPQSARLADHIRDLYERNDVPWDSDVNIGSFRNPEDREKDVYNDILFLVMSGHVYVYIGSVDPGVRYHDPDYRRRLGWTPGAAYLSQGYHKNSWVVGYHGRGRNRHLALVQIGGPVGIRRDKNANFELDPDEVVTYGYFGINRHVGRGETIGLYGGGCTVSKGAAYHVYFMDRLLEAERFKRNRRARISQTLFDIETIGVGFADELYDLAADQQAVVLSKGDFTVV